MGKSETSTELPVAQNAILRAWDHIVFYVGTSLETVKGWEQHHDFPVRRISPDAAGRRIRSQKRSR